MNLFKLLIIWTAFAAYLVGKFRIKSRYKSANQDDNSKNIFFVVVTALPLIFLTGFRHNMGTDYLTYQYIYEYQISRMSISDIIKSGREILFSFLQKVIGEISNYNIVVLMTCLASITVVCYYYMFRKYSYKLWLSVLLLLVIGSYNTCFNTTRQYMAAALYFVAGIFVYKKKPLAYFIMICLISEIHTSAILLLPFYWLLNLNIKDKRHFVIVMVLAVFCAYLLINVRPLVRIVKNILFSSADASSIGLQSADIGIYGLVRPAFFILFVLLNFKLINFENREERCQFNAVLYFVLFQLLASQVYLAYRFTYYFLPFILLFIPNIIGKSSPKRRLINYVFVLSFLLFYFLVGQAKLQYIPIWESV